MYNDLTVVFHKYKSNWMVREFQTNGYIIILPYMNLWNSKTFNSVNMLPYMDVSVLIAKTFNSRSV